METNFKGSSGNFRKIFAENNCRSIRNEGGILVRFWKPHTFQGQEERHDAELAETQANQQLCLDAFNVRQQINVDLPELLKQRNELLEVMKGVLSDIHSGNYPNGEWKVDEIENLITKIEQK